MGLVIKEQVDGDTAVLSLEGRLWVLDLPLRDRVHALLDKGCRYFVFDLMHVDYIDSSGLGQLVAMWTSVRTKEGNLCVVRPSSRVQRLLKVTKLGIIFDVFEDLEKACGAVRRGL
jgi:anti-sigma B factor antagonist